MMITLPGNELLRIDGRRKRLSLHCLTGTIWVTDGSGRDYLLGAGRTFTVSGPGPVIVESLAGAELRLLEGEVAAKDAPALRLAVS